MWLTLVQSSLTWQNPQANRRFFTQKLAPLRGQTDLVVLPEMFTTGFTMEADLLAEPMDGPTVEWLSATARELGAAVTGSFICSENGRHFNRLVFAFPDGRLDFYDKKHLFGLAGEHEHFTTNNKKLVVEWLGVRIRPLICYDLRFPVWSRNDPGQPYDLLLYVANWPARRAHHWRTLLQARAIENQAFVAGVNIVGTDGKGLEYNGDSQLVDFSGQEIIRISGQEAMVTAVVSTAELQDYRRQLPFLADADAFELC